MSGVKLKRVAVFPRQVVGGAGIDVEKQNGNFTISLDYAEFGLHSPYVPQSNHRVVILAQGASGYFTIPATALSPLNFEPATAHNVTLSNSNLTATNTGTTSTDQGAHMAFTSAKSAGKYYFEIQETTLGPGGSYGMGICLTSATFSGLGVNGVGGAISYLNVGANSTWVNGTLKIASFLTPANGNWNGMAVDLDHLTYWIRNATTSGQWNGSGAANPATNVGGFVLPAGSYVPVSVFGGASGTAGTVQTANFGASAFVGAVPSGFTSGWPQ